MNLRTTINTEYEECAYGLSAQRIWHTQANNCKTGLCPLYYGSPVQIQNSSKETINSEIRLRENFYQAWRQYNDAPTCSNKARHDIALKSYLIFLADAGGCSK